MNVIDVQRLDLNLLLVLQAIHTEGSLTRASERLHVTQPAVSHALRRLREALGDPLFVRQGAAMVPTPFTRQIMEPVRAALEALQSALSGARGYEPSQSTRRFRLGIRDSLEGQVVPRLVARLRKAAPRVRLVCVPLDRPRLADDLASGTLDGALDIPIRVGEGVLQQPLPGADPLVVLAPPDHPAVVEEAIPLEAYLAHAHVAVSSRRSGLTIEDAALARLGRRRDIALCVQSHAVAVQVAREQGWLLTLAERFCPPGRHDGLAAFAPPFALPPIQYRLYFHRSQQDDPALCWLREQITAAFDPGANGPGDAPPG